MSASFDPSALIQFVDEMNRTYETLHTRKEDAFWASYMNLAEDADQAKDEMVATEVALKNWISDPKNLKAVREKLVEWNDHKDSLSFEKEPTWQATYQALQGWERTFAANALESEEARNTATALIEAEGQLARARDQMSLGYQLPGQPWQQASSIRLSGMLNSEADEATREAAWRGLRSIETHVLEHGFLDIVKQRNRLARLCGASDFYAWRVQQSEGMTKAEIFDLLEALEAKTRDAGERAMSEMKRRLGSTPLQPWNALFAIHGDLTHAMDPYFPFAKSLLRWGQCFTAMGIRFRHATLKLDLLDRKGKYENGFMHGPVPAWRDHGQFRPARIHFTTNAIPTQVGAGYRSMQTFLHEGGHAAHFANIDMPSPCFSQEFAPTSVAFAEIQSIFMDNLMRDADWLQKYARNLAGESLPMELIERSVRENQPFEAWKYRAWLAVPFFEKALYELPENKLTTENVLRLARQIEQQMTLLPDGSHRPLLSIPHLLNMESSAYYHGYVLAQMGVDQTRDWFASQGLPITDNPQVGPLLAEHYWRPGNWYTLHDFLERLTGSRLSEHALAERVGFSSEHVIQQARQLAASSDPAPRTPEVDLEATLSVVDGNEIVTSTEHQSFAAAAAEFERWIQAR